MRRAGLIAALLAAAALVAAHSTAARIARGGPPPSETPTGYRYVVAPGDSLLKISKKHYGAESRWREIAQANGITDPSKLAVGSAITVPGYELPSRGRDDADGGSGGLVLADPIRHALPWRIIWRALASYALAATVIALAVLADAAGRQRAEARELARSGFAMLCVAVVFLSVVVVETTFAAAWGEGISRSGALGFVAGALIIAGATLATGVVMTHSLGRLPGQGVESRCSMRMLAMLAAASAAGLLFASAGGELTAAAAFLGGCIEARPGGVERLQFTRTDADTKEYKAGGGISPSRVRSRRHV